MTVGSENANVMEIDMSEAKIVVVGERVSDSPPIAGAGSVSDPQSCKECQYHGEVCKTLPDCPYY